MKKTLLCIAGLLFAGAMAAQAQLSGAVSPYAIQTTNKLEFFRVKEN